MAEVTICKIEELPEGEMRLIEAEDGRKIGVFHCEGGELFGIEDRCSHDDGSLLEGEAKGRETRNLEHALRWGIHNSWVQECRRKHRRPENQMMARLMNAPESATSFD